MTQSLCSLAEPGLKNLSSTAEASNILSGRSLDKDLSSAAAHCALQVLSETGPASDDDAVYIHIYIHVTHICTSHICVHTHIHVYAHIYIHTCIHTRIHHHLSSSSSSTTSIYHHHLSSSSIIITCHRIAVSVYHPRFFLSMFLHSSFPHSTRGPPAC